jgi:hypothetical protein
MSDDELAQVYPSYGLLVGRLLELDRDILEFTDTMRFAHLKLELFLGMGD